MYTTIQKIVHPVMNPTNNTAFVRLAYSTLIGCERKYLLPLQGVCNNEQCTFHTALQFDYSLPLVLILKLFTINANKMKNLTSKIMYV